MTKIEAPLWQALLQNRHQHATSFHMPGHKYGVAAPEALVTAWGAEMWQYDVTELPGLDNLAAPSGVIAAAQQLLADFCQVQKAYFLINGATVGLQAAILACCHPGEQILVPRHAHHSVWAALALAKVEPVWLPVAYHPQYGTPLGITRETLQHALAAHPQAKALFCVAPTYHGIVTNLKEQVALAAACGIPTIVDAAHGSHFHSGYGPEPAVASGASFVVESWHKTMGSLTQTAVLLQQDTTWPVERYLRLLQSSSPSYLLMASLDVTRAMWQQNRDVFAEKLCRLSTMARQGLAQIPILQCLGTADWPEPVWAWDASRLVLVSKREHSGGQIATALRRYGIEPEMADASTVVLFLTIADEEATIQHLLHACQQAAIDLAAETPAAWPLIGDFPIPPQKLLPADALAQAVHAVPLSGCSGGIAGAAITPYPPGIPLVGLGEEISQQTISQLKQILKEGGMVQGLASVCPPALWLIDAEK